MNAKYAWVLEYDQVHVLCLTPCCGKLVRHGACGGDYFEGHRAPHCQCKEEYYVKKGEFTKKVNEINFKG